MPSQPAAPRPRAGDSLVPSSGMQTHDGATSQLLPSAHLDSPRVRPSADVRDRGPEPPTRSYQAPHSTHTTSTGFARKLGKLGIPVPSDDDESDSESVEANPPHTPTVARPRTVSRGGSSRGRKGASEPLPRTEGADEEREGSAWSETGFRDIVDDLTVQSASSFWTGPHE